MHTSRHKAELVIRVCAELVSNLVDIEVPGSLEDSRTVRRRRYTDLR